MEITYEQIKEILAETARQQQESSVRADREMAKLQSSIADTERMVKQNQKQLGEMGNKWGSFAEGLAYPTVERILREQFGLTHISQNVEVSKGNDWLEIDAFGYTNGTVNRAVAAEIKSHFRSEDVEQLEKICEKIPDFMPEHSGKAVFGMVVFVKGEKNAINRAIKRGLYVVQANDDSFQLLSPPNFVARDFSK